jgi:putative oxidoreductase
MKKIQIVLRVLLGLVYFVFGLNGFFQFIPMPQDMPLAVKDFMTSFMAAGMLSLVKTVEIIGGAMLLSGNYLTLGIILLAPITVNILLFHVNMTPGEWQMGAVMLAAHLTLAWTQKEKLSPLFKR